MKILNAGPGFSQPMTEDETILFLTSGRRNIYIASLDEKNEPNIHPVWYYFDSSNQKIAFQTFGQYFSKVTFENGILINGYDYPADWDTIGSFKEIDSRTKSFIGLSQKNPVLLDLQRRFDLE